MVFFHLRCTVFPVKKKKKYKCKILHQKANEQTIVLFSVRGLVFITLYPSHYTQEALLLRLVPISHFVHAGVLWAWLNVHQLSVMLDNSSIYNLEHCEIK